MKSDGRKNYRHTRTHKTVRHVHRSKRYQDSGTDYLPVCPALSLLFIPYGCQHRICDTLHDDAHIGSDHVPELVRPRILSQYRRSIQFTDNE